MIPAVGSRVVDTRTGRQGMTTAYSTTTDIYYVRDGVGGVWLVPAELLVRDPDPLAWALLYGDTHTDSSAAELAEPVHNATTKGNSCPDG